MTKEELKKLKKNLIESINNITISDIENQGLDNLMLYDSDKYQLSLMIK